MIQDYTGWYKIIKHCTGLYKTVQDYIGLYWTKYDKTGLYLNRNLQDYLGLYMGHQDQNWEKVGQMSLFDWKFEAATDREKQKFMHFRVLLACGV